MSPTDPQVADRQSKRFLYLYALAVSGGSVAYVPFLTILLPNQVALLHTKGALELLAHTAFAGAIAASMANILFGWASDKTKSRRPWIASGLFLSSVLLPLMPLANTATMLVLMITCWQVGLNMMLAPLAAWAGDTVPDGQKGFLGGLLAFAPALGALSGVLITFPGVADDDARLVIISVLVVFMVSPALVLGGPKSMPQLMTAAPQPDAGYERPGHNRIAVVQMWVARLLVQIAEASLFAFLLLWFRSIDPAFADNDAATIFATMLCVAVILALIIGRWSDNRNRPIQPLTACAVVASLGLVIMAFSGSLLQGVGGYVIFGLASTVFLSLHSSRTLGVLRTPANRGRDLGYFNLTNTVPSIIMPWITLAMVPAYGFNMLFLLLAALSCCAAILLAQMQHRSAA